MQIEQRLRLDVVAYVLFYITLYIALAVFVGGVAYQVYRWRRKSPVPAHMSLYPRPEGRLERPEMRWWICSRSRASFA